MHRCDDRDAAEQLANDVTKRHARQRHTGSSLTLAEYLLGQWLPAKESTLAPTTHARYVTSVEHHLLPHLGNTPLRRLRTEHFEALYRRLLVGSRRGGPLAAKTITNLHQIVRSSLNDAVERGLLASNPSSGAQVPDPPQAPIDSTPCPLVDRDRTRRLPDRSRREPLLDAVPIGRRATEMTQALTSIGYRLEFSRLKTRTSRRNITVDADTMDLLARWRQDQTTELAEAGVANVYGLVFAQTST